MRLDEYQIANALIDTRLVMTSIGWGVPNKDGRNMLQRQWWCWHLRQLQPAADIGARKKPVDKHGSEVHVQVSGDVRDRGDPVQEFASLRNLGPQTPAEGSHGWPGRARKKAKAAAGCCR
jgi:hypothetical protein